LASVVERLSSPRSQKTVAGCSALIGLHQQRRGGRRPVDPDFTGGYRPVVVRVPDASAISVRAGRRSRVSVFWPACDDEE